MSSSVLERYGIDAHPILKRATLLLVFGVVLVAVGVTTAVAIHIGGLVFVATGGLFAYSGAMLRRDGAVVPAINRSLQELRAGRLEGTEELLAYAESKAPTPHLQRAIDLQRAFVAARRGDFEAQRAAADRALERPSPRRSETYNQQQRAAALGLRALARASLGEREGALEDVEAVRGHAYAEAEVVARAELAAAVLLERSGDRDALRQHLDAHRELMADHLLPYETELVRAFERLVSAATQSVYRKPAKEGDRLDAQQWVARVSPEAAAFVTTLDAASEPLAASAPTTDVAKKAAAEKVQVLTKRRGTPRWLKPLLLWIAVVLLFLIVFLLLDGPSEPGPGPAPPGLGNAVLYGLPGIAMLFLVGAIIWQVATQRRMGRELVSARRELQIGDAQAARANLVRLATSRFVLPACQAELALAKADMDALELDEALARTERALARLSTPALRALASDHVLPDLMTARARALALAGRVDEADELVATLGASCPDFHGLHSARAKVAVARAARQGDLPALAELAGQTWELPLGGRDQLLVDLGRAAHGSATAGAGEVARLRRLMKEGGRQTDYVRDVAPDVVRAFEQATALPPAT